MSNNSSSPRDSGIDSSQQTTEEQSQSMSPKPNSAHYVENHSYTVDDFAKRGETTRFSSIRVHDASGSDESEEFENLTEVRQSDWTINWASGARLSDSTILYEGRQ